MAKHGYRKGGFNSKSVIRLGLGISLVFTYNGNSQFDVLIFDTTASEISYPVEGTKSESESDDDSVVFLENLEASRNPLKTKQDGEKRKHIPSKSKTVAKETCPAYQKALAYKCGTAKSDASQQQPFFISLMQQSYVSHNFILTVPASVIMTSFLCNGTKRNTSFPNLYLMMNGRKWCVKCWVKSGIKSAKISRGWKKFAQDNGLKLGDACILEARKRVEFVWDVMVFRS